MKRFREKSVHSVHLAEPTIGRKNTIDCQLSRHDSQCEIPLKMSVNLDHIPLVLSQGFF
jgi:hypothetical protein